jgi:hypothetical protein
MKVHGKKSIFNLIEVNDEVESNSKCMDVIIKSSNKDIEKSKVCQKQLLLKNDDVGSKILFIKYN